MRITAVADLHFSPQSYDRIREAMNRLRDEADLLILAGDIGAGEPFDVCLKLFDGLACRKALVPGNHDVWVRAGDSRGSSRQSWRSLASPICTLDQGSSSVR